MGPVCPNFFGRLNAQFLRVFVRFGTCGSTGLSIALILFLAQSAHAGSTTWNGATSTDWNTAGNWPGGIPSTSVDATFGSVATTRFTADIATSGGVKFMTFATGANAGAFTISGAGTLTIG